MNARAAATRASAITAARRSDRPKPTSDAGTRAGTPPAGTEPGSVEERADRLSAWLRPDDAPVRAGAGDTDTSFLATTARALVTGRSTWPITDWPGEARCWIASPSPLRTATSL